MSLLHRLMAVCVLAASLVGCSDDGDQAGDPLSDAGVDAQDDVVQADVGQADVGQADVGQPDVAPDAGPQAATKMRFEPTSSDFFSVPFPSDTRRRADGSFGFRDWEGAYDNNLLHLWFDAADDLMEGWGLVSGIFVNFDGPIDPGSLPQTAAETASTDDGFSSVFLINVDPQSAHQGELVPIECQFKADAGTYHDANLLGCISPFGVVRRANTRYAFVVTRQLEDAAGEPVGADPAMANLLAGQSVDGRDGPIAAAAYADAKTVVADAGFDADQIAAITVFTTGDPAHRIVRLHDWYRELPDPQIDAGSLTMVRQFDNFVVLRGSYEAPIIQQGRQPFSSPPAGKVVFGDDGQPEQQSTDTVPFLLTIPTAPMPDGGWPVLMYMHGSGGQAQELIDRGARPDIDTDAPAGSGPGGVVADYGIAGFAAEFPFHGTRFDPPDTTGLKLYNLLGNPRATVDNFLVSANEVGLDARLLKGLAFDADIAEGALDAGAAADGMVRFNDDSLTAMGQSMGSTIGLPALTISQEIDAGILSGSGGTLIEVALKSTKPLDLKPVLEQVLQYGGDEHLDRFDPVLSAVQYTWDFIDPEVHARHLIDEPHQGIPAKHILQHSGVDDGYFSVYSRTAVSAAAGLDFVNPVEEPAALDIMSVAAPAHDQAVDAPVSANLDGSTTGVVAMYPPDDVMDGHNVAYQRDDAKAQYACFAKSVGADGPPTFKSVAQSQPDTCQ